MFIDLEKRADLHCAKSGSLVVFHYLAQTTAEQARADSRHLRTIVDAHGHISILVILDAKKIGQPDPEVKKELAQQTRDLGEKRLGSCMVVLGNDIRATIWRTMFIAFGLMAGASGKQKTVANVSDGLKWLAAHPQQSADVRGLSAQEVERHFGLAT